MRYTVTVERDGYRRLKLSTKGLLEHGCQKAANEGVDAAVQHAKATDKFQDRSGTLRGSIRFERAIRKARQLYEAVLVATAKWARHVEWGTRPHWIHPRREGGRLFFWWEKKNRWFDGDPDQGVWHPGIEPTFFMSLAARKGFYVMKASLEDTVNRVARMWKR